MSNASPPLVLVSNRGPVTFEEDSQGRGYMVIPLSSVDPGHTLSILRPTNSQAILEVVTQQGGTAAQQERDTLIRLLHEHVTTLSGTRQA